MKSGHDFSTGAALLGQLDVVCPSTMAGTSMPPPPPKTRQSPIHPCYEAARYQRIGRKPTEGTASQRRRWILSSLAQPTTRRSHFRGRQLSLKGNPSGDTTPSEVKSTAAPTTCRKLSSLPAPSTTCLSSHPPPARSTQNRSKHKRRGWTRQGRNSIAEVGWYM